MNTIATFLLLFMTIVVIYQQGLIYLLKKRNRELESPLRPAGTGGAVSAREIVVRWLWTSVVIGCCSEFALSKAFRPIQALLIICLAIGAIGAIWAATAREGKE